MTRSRKKIALAVAIALALVVAGVITTRATAAMSRTRIVAYFDNTNGLFRGDDVRILGVTIGGIEAIEPLPDKVKVSFWVDDKYQVPADAKAAILSPQLVSARAIQLTPAYTSGPVMHDGAVIPISRTAVPVEWDDLRQQLQKLTDTLQPTNPGGVSSAGAFIDTAANNLRGQGASIHDALVKLSQAVSILGDHSDDTFGTIKNLSVLVSALHDSAGLLRQLNGNLAAVTALLAEDPERVGQAVSDLNAVVAESVSFLTENKEPLGVATDKLASISQAVHDSIDDIKQSLHILPNAFQNYVNIYQPSQAASTGALAINNFSNPIGFLCGAIQAASRLGAEQAAKLCVQYLAPIIKNRQYNFPPFGENILVGQSARPNEITYTEDWLRPDHVPPPAPTGPAPSMPPPAGQTMPPLPAEAPSEAPAQSTSTDPNAGLAGIMNPAGSGS